MLLVPIFLLNNCLKKKCLQKNTFVEFSLLLVGKCEVVHAVGPSCNRNFRSVFHKRLNRGNSNALANKSYFESNSRGILEIAAHSVDADHSKVSMEFIGYYFFLFIWRIVRVVLIEITSPC